MIIIIIALIGSAAFGLVRLMKSPQMGGLRKADVFKDLAHIWVGAIFGLALGSDDPSIYWMLFGALCFIEVVIGGLRGRSVDSNADRSDPNDLLPLRRPEHREE